MCWRRRSLSEHAFSLVASPPFPATLASSGTLQLRIRFRPARTGTIRDTLVIPIAECSAPTLIALEGNGDQASLRIIERIFNFRRSVHVVILLMQQ